MNKLRPLVAGLLLLAAGASARLTTTINVTTAMDEDNTNLEACSLREAVKAVNTHQPYGGCDAGSVFNENVIQLDAIPYYLQLGELQISAEVTILGKDSQKAAHDAAENPLTGKAPLPVRPDNVEPLIGATGTSITAAPGSRIFNALAGLSLRDLVLNGNGTVADKNGGLIFAGASASLENVIAQGGSVTGTTGSSSAGNGGAIYLGGSDTQLDLTNSTVIGNSAQNKGGAVAMLCQKDVAPLAVHTVNVTRSLLRSNSSGQGAGAIDFCGSVIGTLTASTFSGNTSATGSGTLTYLQSAANAGFGRLTINAITAAEEQGHVLVTSRLASILMTGSLLAFNSQTACLAPSGAMMTSTTPGGNYNALQDNSCDVLMVSGNTNVDLSANSFAQVLNPLTNGPFGLTDYYLPVAGSPVLDGGEPFDNCVEDQRDIERGSNTSCDIGSIERMTVTAVADEGASVYETDRKAIVDVLENDSFGEDESGPFGFRDNTTLANRSVVVTTTPTSDPTGTGTCTWLLSSDADHPDRLIVDTKGELTTLNAPVVCTYQAVDSQGNTSASATVTVQIKNAPPQAEDDEYIRAVGSTEITFNPLENDNDEGDGKYGFAPERDGNGDIVLDGSGNVVYTDEPDWASFNPVEIVGKPQLGAVVGVSSGACPGSSLEPKTCLTPPLRYVASNNLSPFSDSFTYRVYDADGGSSGAATVTIGTDASDPDHGGGAGSLDIIGGLLISLLGLRRLRRL